MKDEMQAIQNEFIISHAHCSISLYDPDNEPLAQKHSLFLHLIMANIFTWNHSTDFLSKVAILKHNQGRLVGTFIASISSKGVFLGLRRLI